MSVFIFHMNPKLIYLFCTIMGVFFIVNSTSIYADSSFSEWCQSNLHISRAVPACNKIITDHEYVPHQGALHIFSAGSWSEAFARRSVGDKFPLDESGTITVRSVDETFQKMDVMLTAANEVIFKTTYQELPGIKAFAIGPAGIATWSYGADSIEQAKKTALLSCKRSLKKLNVLSLRSRPCRIYAINSQVIMQDAHLNPALDKRLPIPDRPLISGLKIDLPEGVKPKGIVLFLHGCKGNYKIRPVRVFGDFLRTRQFILVSPNSFSENRPPSMCGITPLAKMGLRDLITRVRIAQTKRTIRILRKQYPDLPIFIWGHSEGSGIAQMIDNKVAGIIASGHVCSHFGAIAVRETVPLLVIIGGLDPYARPRTRLHSKDFTKRRCSELFRSKLWKVRYYPSLDHKIDIWQKPIMREISSFLGIRPAKLDPVKMKGEVSLTKGGQLLLRRFLSSGRPHRALAVGPDGIYGYVSGQKTRAQAIQKSLYECGKQTDVGPFPIDMPHPCKLFAVNNETYGKVSRH